MEYYQILNFQKEPFSNSPEPEFLFQSPQHTTCLQMLELAVRLRRGLNVVIGDVGTGKTTLCRKLIQDFSHVGADSPEIETHLLLDPALASTREFLQTVAALLGIRDLDSKQDEWHLKEKIKNYLFSKGVDEGKIIVLIIDEGQKIPEACIEVLREFLNYETNSQKLLQIIIFAQKEFQSALKKHHNLTDRVNCLYYLKALSFRQTRAMINYRVEIAREAGISQPLFSFWGLALIYAATGGYPRKIVSLCHQVILMLIIRGRKKAGLMLVKSSISEMSRPLFVKARWAAASILVIVAIGLSAGAFFTQRPGADTPEHKSASAFIKSPVNTPDENLPVSQKIESKMPESLGTIKISKGSTIWQISQKIYGSTESEIISAVIKANRQIKDANKIPAGASIRLPSIPSGNVSVKKGDYIIQIEESKNIENAYNAFSVNTYPQSISRAVFFPMWNKKEEEIRFAVIINKCFGSMRDVETAIEKLPPSIGAKSKILARLDENTVFFNRTILLR